MMDEISLKNQQIYESIIETEDITYQILKTILKGVSKQINAIEFTKLLPLIGFNWFVDQVAIIIQENDIENDNFIDEHMEDNEPQPVNIENWRSYQGSIIQNQQKINDMFKRGETKMFSKNTTFMKTRRESDVYQAQIIQTDFIDDENEFDPNIESLRQAKLRQISILQQKQLNEKVKIQEAQEQVKQLKRLNVDSKSKYTFDCEGKVIIQKGPDTEKFPKSFQTIQEKRNLVEVKDLDSKHVKEVESIHVKHSSIQQIPQNQFLSKTSIPQIDLIVIKEGVSYYEGKNEKRNERSMPLLEIKDPLALNTSLSKSNLRITKLEYEAITNTVSHNSFQNKTLSLSHQILQKQQMLTSRNDQDDFHIINDTNQSGIKQKLTTINNSISSSIYQKINGSISILSEQYLEDIIESQQQIINEKKEKKEKILSLIKKKNSEPKLKDIKESLNTIELPQIPPNILSNRIVKLPKSHSTSGTLPKLLAKLPRDRLQKQVLTFKIEL